MKQLLFWIGVLFVFLPGVLSCSMGNDDEQLGVPGANHPYNIAYGTVEGTPADFRVILDNGVVLVIEQNNVLLEATEAIDGQRMLVSFTVLSVETLDGLTFCYVRLNGMRKVESASR